VTGELRFYVQPEAQRVVGPLSDDLVREALRGGSFPADVRVRLASAPLWLPARAWAALGLDPGLPPPAPVTPEENASPDLMLAPGDVLDVVRFAVVRSLGSEVAPTVDIGASIRQAVGGGRLRHAWIAPLGTADWVPARRLFDRTLTEGAVAFDPGSAPDLKTTRCPVCRELVPAATELCPECEEPLAAAPASRGSFHEEPEGASWIKLHWRPLVTFAAITSLIMTGIALRYVAPERFAPEVPQEPAGTPPAPPACESPCWTGEACQEQICVWQKPNGVGHVAARPGIAGPFALPADVTDAILLDDDRFAIGLLGGTEIRSTRTGQSLGLVSEAAHTRKLVRAGDAVYAVGPQHVAVLDIGATRVTKTLELGAIIGDVTVGANGRRALVSLPGAHAIAILSTELHAELDRIRFGDDPVGPVGVDDTGERALTTTGTVPVPGLPDTQGGAVYAFDPSRLATEQDRVRAAMVGNPVAVLMAPDGASAYVVLRAKSKIVALEWLPSGSVRTKGDIAVCDQPEQIELLRKGRKAAVRCRRGQAVELVDLERASAVRHVPLGAPVADMAVTPDAERVVVALPEGDAGSIVIIDTDSFEVDKVPLTEPPSRVRLSADGRTVLVLSDRSKVAWVLR
jgi:DNA-binding beta-propeller fold protein YncE